jgi:hypothetical protein
MGGREDVKLQLISNRGRFKQAFAERDIKKLDFLGHKWHSRRSLPFQGPKKSRFSWPIPSNGALIMDVARIITSRAIKNNKYINSYKRLILTTGSDSGLWGPWGLLPAGQVYRGCRGGGRGRRRGGGWR